jgi:predicted anti-sigma-YlaC factor YlaD
MTNHKWPERLSEYLDGELNKMDRDALEAHLGGCAECSALLEEIRAVTVRAGSLDDRPPARDLWAGIAERIGASSGMDIPTPRASAVSIESAPSFRRKLFARRVTLGLPQLAAAAIALVVASGAVVGSFIGSGTGSAARGSSTVPVGAGVVTVANLSDLGGARYDSAVAELEQALSANKGNLDSTTVRIIRQNIAIIDQAIDQAQRALAADPANSYLSNHLAGTLKRKVELLRRATALNAVQS